MTFGDRLRKMRLERGLTQEQLAQQIGVAKSTLTGYEKGNREPDVFKIKRILEVLDMDSDYLLGISRKNKKSPATEEPSTEDDQERKRLLKNYDDLNEEGREKLLEQSEFLVSCGKYKRNIKNNPPNLGKADIDAEVETYQKELLHEKEADEFAEIARQQYLAEKKRESGTLSVKKSGAG